MRQNYLADNIKPVIFPSGGTTNGDTATNVEDYYLVNGLDGSAIRFEVVKPVANAVFTLDLMLNGNVQNIEYIVVQSQDGNSNQFQTICIPTWVDSNSARLHCRVLIPHVFEDMSIAILSVGTSVEWYGTAHYCNSEPHLFQPFKA